MKASENVTETDQTVYLISDTLRVSVPEVHFKNVFVKPRVYPDTRANKSLLKVADERSE